ncbi:sigma D regulator [Echinimonas agarilytica]|uniref:Sigma D regulator n=1 Tax=Echinimonas agarilytica TaxID=1215918 RepID=A0AA41W3Z5_9GAMM|nr:sigma D regulator [Echinimonas agarilytica]MCM2678394.1 sigma D regulator [Echinimonas agarilytica]
MLSRLEQAQKTWGGSDKAIDKWLSERETLLVQYCKLSGLKPFEHVDKLPSAKELHNFCDELLDYTSAGHFEMYDKLVGTEQPEGAHLASRVYPQINATTDVVLNFNDSYGESPDDSEFQNLEQDLCTLGEALSQRFELEDLLIANLAEQTKTKDSVSA